jgi:hypothetical protein
MVLPLIHVNNFASIAPDQHLQPGGAANWFINPKEGSMSLADILKRWKSRQTGIRRLVSLNSSQRGELARDLALPEDVVIRLMARGSAAQEELQRLTDVLGLNIRDIKASHPGLARDVSVACAECAAVRRCRRELDAGSARANYHDYCPNADAFDDLRLEAWRGLKRRRQIGISGAPRTA